MKTKNEIHAIIEELRKGIPSFYTVPVSSDEEARVMDEKKIIGAIVIQDGKFKDHTVILRRIEVKGPKLEIDYTSVDKDKNNVQSKELDTIVGNLINYFFAMEALKHLDNEERT